MWVVFVFFYSFISVLFRKSVISPHDLFFYFFFSLVFDIYKKTNNNKKPIHIVGIVFRSCKTSFATRVSCKDLISVISRNV